MIIRVGGGDHDSPSRSGVSAEGPNKVVQVLRRGSGMSFLGWGNDPEVDGPASGGTPVRDSALATGTGWMGSGGALGPIEASAGMSSISERGLRPKADPRRSSFELVSSSDSTGSDPRGAGALEGRGAWTG